MGRVICLHQALCLLFSFLHFQVISSSLSTQLCQLDQSLALLQFRDTFFTNSFDSSSSCDSISSYPKTDSWKEGTDCCSWYGVTCDRLTGHVIGLNLSYSCLYGNIHSNSSLFLLPHLRKLNLAYNDFNFSPISSKFGRFTSLKHLNLSYSRFDGLVPFEISLLSKLVSLDLSYNFLKIDQHNFELIVQNLTKIKYMHFDSMNLSLVAPSSFLNLSSSLISLSTKSVGLQGNFPDNVFHLPYLQELSLSANYDLTVTFPPKSNWSSSLWSLDLSGITFLGEIPDSISNLKSLKNLNLRDCKLTSSIPVSLWNLTQITSMDLSSNNFIGPIPSSISNLVQLSILDLSLNSFTGQIPDIFGNFSKITYLSLYFNKFFGSIPSSLSNLVQLTHLDLSYNNFSGQIPDVFSNFSKITYLSLSKNSFSGQLPSSAFNLKQLEYLEFLENKLEGPLPYQVSGLSNLTSLDLSYNLLSGRIPSWLFTLPSLQSLDMGNNKLTGPIDQFQLPNALKRVYLGNNEIHGSIPSSIFHLRELRNLDLSSNNLSGIIEPYMLSNLENLEVLCLSNNSLLSLRGSSNVNYTLPNLRGLRMSSCNTRDFPNFLRTLESLGELDLSNNQIAGRISKWELEGWQSLFVLNLSYNLLEGPLPVPPASLQVYLVANNKLTGEIPSLICNLSSLVVLDLSNNSLTGMLPKFLGNFSNKLSVLNLQMNKINGSIPGTFSKGNSLRNVGLNGNQLEGPLPRSLVHCSNLEVLDLGNNKINDTFPLWLESLQELQVLILRSNRFHGQIGNLQSQNSFTNLRIIDLSHNEFTGLLPTRLLQNNFQAMEYEAGQNVEKNITTGTYYKDSVVVIMNGLDLEIKRDLTTFPTIDLSNNRFEGPLLVPPPFLVVYLVANNKLTGEIPSLICNLRSLVVLDLSNNSLVGILPKCLGNFSNKLSVLNLQMNKINGSIPGTFSKGNSLRNVGLNGNQLEGPLPRSLVHCSNLEVLDLGNNKINDTFPLWLESLLELQVLILLSNRFHGQIGNLKSKNSFTNLRIIDLSHNDFTGLLPTRLLENLQAMMSADERNVEKKYMGGTYYEDSVVVTMKGSEFKLERILTTFTTIDLSSNRFQGEIPEVIEKFKSLIVLNFSHNSLTGHIPSSLGNITALESLDLSSNILVGKIPVQLTILTFLEVLNLSHNQLVGPIPRGRQFDTFENDSYSGNSGLCDLPLSKKCRNDEAPQPLPSISHEDEDSGSGFDWKITMMGYGCGLVFGLSMGYIVFSTGKPQWFVRLVEGDRHKKPVRRPRQSHQGRRN